MGYGGRKELIADLKTLNTKKHMVVSEEKDLIKYLKNLRTKYYGITTDFRVYIDFLVDLTRTLAIESKKGPTVKGKKIVDFLFRKVSKYAPYCSVVYAAMDGSSRPKTKEIAKRYEDKSKFLNDETEEGMDDLHHSMILVNDNQFPTHETWFKYKGIAEFRARVYKYICTELTNRWSAETYTQGVKLIIGNGVIGDSDDFQQVTVDKGSVETKVYKTPIGEGEQLIFHRINKVKTEDKVVVLVDSIDSDMIAYSVAYGNHSTKDMFLLMKNSKKKKTFEYLTFNVKGIVSKLKQKYFDITNSISNVDYFLTIVFVYALRGLDFSPLIGSTTCLENRFPDDPQEPKKKLKRLIFRIQKIRDGVIGYVQRTGDSIIWVDKSGECRIDEIQLLKIIASTRPKATLTRQQERKILASIRNIRWFFNYAMHPGDPFWVNNFNSTLPSGESEWGYTISNSDGRCYQTLNVAHKYFDRHSRLQRIK